MRRDVVQQKCSNLTHFQKESEVQMQLLLALAMPFPMPNNGDAMYSPQRTLLAFAMPVMGYVPLSFAMPKSGDAPLAFPSAVR
jgi:hypothetical protein